MTRTPPRSRRSGARPARRGFTILETVVAVAVFLLVMAMTLELWTGLFRDWAKGEDTLDSVQDASLVILHLRRDLSGMTFPTDRRPWHLRHRRIRGQDFAQDDFTYDPATRALERRRRASEVETTIYRQDESVLSFFRHDVPDGGFVPVTYTYLPEERTIVRKLGSRPPQSFALPRLRDFEVQLEAEARGDEAGATPRTLFGQQDEVASFPLRRLWFRVRFRVKGEEHSGGAATTRVDVETRIFPKGLNRRLVSRWSHEP